MQKRPLKHKGKILNIIENILKESKMEKKLSGITAIFSLRKWFRNG